MSAAAMAGRVGGPTYFNGSSSGIAGAAASLGVAAASVERDADEHAPSTVTEHTSTDEKHFTITPWKEQTGVGCMGLPRWLLDRQGRFERHIQNRALYRDNRDSSLRSE